MSDNNNPYTELDNEQLLERFDEVVTFASVSNDENRVLAAALERFEKFVNVDESLLKGLKEIISYPGVLAEQDVKTLKDLLAHITQTDKS